MSHSHLKWPDLPEVDNDLEKPFRNSALQSPLLAGVPTGVNKPNGTGTPPLSNWPEQRESLAEEEGFELPFIAGGRRKGKK